MDRADAKFVALRKSAAALVNILEEVSERVGDLRVMVSGDAASPADVRALASAAAELDFARERLSIALARLEHAKHQPGRKTRIPEWETDMHRPRLSSALTTSAISAHLPVTTARASKRRLRCSGS
jgi:hypothetical protein